MEAGLLSGVAGQQLVDLGGRHLVGHAEDGRAHEEQNDRHDEVRDRARDDDGEPLPRRLGLEIVVVVLAVVAERTLLLGLGRLAVLALHGAVAADREEIQPVVRTASLGGPLEQRRTHAEGKVVDPDAVATREQEVAVLVQDHQYRQHDQEQQKLFDRHTTFPDTLAPQT